MPKFDPNTTHSTQEPLVNVEVDPADPLMPGSHTFRLVVEDNDTLRRGIADTLHALAWIQWEQGERQAAIDGLQRSADLLTELIAESGTNAQLTVSPNGSLIRTPFWKNAMPWDSPSSGDAV